MSTNLYEVGARTAKAYTLAQAVKAHAQRAADATHCSFDETLAVAMDAPYRWYCDVAEAAGIRVPSHVTVAAAVALLGAEARAATDLPADPFADFQ